MFFFWFVSLAAFESVSLAVYATNKLFCLINHD